MDSGTRLPSCLLKKTMLVKWPQSDPAVKATMHVIVCQREFRPGVTPAAFQ